MDRLTNERVTESRKTSTPIKRTIFPGKLAWAGASLIAAVGLIHLLEAPEELEEATTWGFCSWPTSVGQSWRRSGYTGATDGAGAWEPCSPEALSWAT